MYPYIFIGGRPIGTYGLCMLLGFFLVAFLSYQKGKQHSLLLEDLLFVGAVAIGCSLVCGGGMYIFVTYPITQIIEFIRQGDFRFLSSGIIFYGGLIGGILGALLGIRIMKCPLSLIEHSVIPFIPLGHAIGRIGCVMAGCCHGFVYDGPFALYYSNSVSGLPPHQGYFPVQPLESIINIGICLLLLKLDKRCKKPFQLLFSYLSIYAICRFSLEFFRGDMIRGTWAGLSTSQWVSIGLLIASATFFAISKFLDHHIHSSSKNPHP